MRSPLTRCSAVNPLLRTWQPSCTSQIRFVSRAVTTHDPLRILFCGADEFSIYSLRALDNLSREREELVDSIDVVCRPDKRVGRGLKHVQAVPIKPVTAELGLNLHQVDSMKGWTPPAPFDLVITVSFGLFVPSAILGAAKYGGLNVHPSLLPQFRGAAPIQRALLARSHRTGVTLQTMDTKKFDHGKILSSVSYDIEEHATPGDLVHQLGPLGADLLVNGIENALFMSADITTGKNYLHERVSYAPKITPEDRHVDWQTWTADEILLRDRVLGRLWDTTTYSRCHGVVSNGQSDHAVRRITFQGPWRTVHSSVSDVPGHPVLTQADGGDIGIGLVAADGVIVVPAEITIESEGKTGGMRALVHALARIQQHTSS
jgi:methionyl-tRNA formyltransferase